MRCLVVNISKVTRQGTRFSGWRRKHGLARASTIVLALVLAACSGGERPTAEPAGGVRRLRAEATYPVARFDLVASVAPGLSELAIRELAGKLATVTGVALTEADYAGRVVRVVLRPGLDAGGREGTRRSISATPGVAAVADAPAG